MDEFGGQPPAANAPVSLLFTMLPLRVADEERPQSKSSHLHHITSAAAQKSPGCDNFNEMNIPVKIEPKDPILLLCIY